jgi:hypothetical protein
MEFIVKNVQLYVAALISFVSLGIVGSGTAKKSAEAEYVEALAEKVGIWQEMELAAIDSSPFNEKTKRGKECNSLSERFVTSFSPNKESASKFDVTDEELSKLRQCIGEDLDTLNEYEDSKSTSLGRIYADTALSKLLWERCTRAVDSNSRKLEACSELSEADNSRRKDIKLFEKKAQLGFLKKHTEMLAQIREAAKNKEN